ncbi:uncharacterized protein [Nicotiana sylvestris]|uniref:uncharacterized protein n=1 Tax=Nicotiana sylvestris TaxID=4096 RepID=UPI00388CAE9E
MWCDPNYLRNWQNVVHCVKKWKASTFGDLLGKKHKLLARLNGIQTSSHYATSSFLQNLEKELKSAYNDLLLIEDDYWKIRSRIMWLNEGDSNMKYFHICATNRRRRNKINIFKDEAGNWINDPLLIMSYVNNYFKDLFTSSHVITSRKNPINPSSNVGQVDLTTLDGPLQEIEIKRAIFSFKPFKAPGPDGLHPFFYQKYWNIIGPSVVKLCKDIFDSQVDLMKWDPITTSRKSPKFSHLFFADDLTLMAKANKKSCYSIKEGLDYFSKISRQKINLAKSKILFSKNCPEPDIKDITNILGIRKSEFFGTYLGFPILNNTPRPRDYHFIIDKMRSQLVAWKMNFLNIAGRTTLAHSCLNSIPNHYMQYTVLPKKILKNIDKVVNAPPEGDNPLAHIQAGE